MLSVIIESIKKRHIKAFLYNPTLRSQKKEYHKRISAVSHFSSLNKTSDGEVVRKWNSEFIFTRLLYNDVQLFMLGRL